MAEVAVDLLLGRLGSLIVEQGNLLGGVGRDVNDLKDDLETLRSFLQDADSRGETDQGSGVKTWVKQVRDVAYDIEDVLDEFLLRLVRPCRNGIFDSLLRKLHCIKQLKTRHCLAIEIQNIKGKLKTITERRRTFSFTDIDKGRITRANTMSNAWHDPRIASLYMDDAEVVGIEVPKNKLIEWLLEGELKLTMISVVGMGGLGKTTLAKKVCDSQMVNQYFDCRVWITISQSPVSTKELLRTTIKQVLKATKEQAPEGMDAMDVNELIQELNNQLLEKRYVIIFDDIWDINVWESMKFAFRNHDGGSRIIFTTRIHEVAKYTKYSYSLEPLPDQEAWRLFCMQAFRSNYHESISCPEELEELSRNILKKCNGLPLAIVLIGGLLARKAKTVWEWKNVHNSVGAEMRNTYKLESLNRILLFSYNSLPYYLKPCFLYLSMFPEDHLINRMKLIRLWIAEGFVEEKEGVTMEVVAGDYVNELISRSMIQIAELNNSDEVKSCKIHDLMRETILLKSKEECFSTTIISGSQSHEGMGLHEKQARRITIFHNRSTGDESYSSYPIPMGSRFSHIRSLTMFQLVDESPTRWSFREKFFRVFRLLRVLDLASADLVKFPPELVELIHLRYLSLRGCTKITVLPKLVGKLKNLETLDLKETHVRELPVEILKLQHLRHLLVYRKDADLVSLTCFVNGVSVPTGRIGNLTCLQKLAFLDVQHQVGCGEVLKELGKLTQLRKLGITNLKSKDGRDLCLSLQKMEHLNSLTIIARSTRKKDDDNDEEFIELESLMLSQPQLLSRLSLQGRLSRLPIWMVNSVRNLTYLCLCDSRLPSCEEDDDDPLKAFQHMSNLIRLDLLRAYDGEELCCSEIGGYKNLKALYLLKMGGLKRVRFMEGSMTMLRELNIGLCPELGMVPHGIEHLMALQELGLMGLHPGLVERIRKRQQPRSPPSQESQPISLLPPRGEGEEEEAQGGGEDCWRVQHIPKYFHVFYNTEGTPVLDKLK